MTTATTPTIPATPVTPQPRPSTPWPDPAPIRPSGPRYADRLSTDELIEASRQVRADLAAAVAESRRVCAIPVVSSRG
jgi:hypothetical protein